MADFLKVQLEFRLAGPGFSEIYYVAGSDPKGYAGSAMDLVRERQKMMVRVAIIHHVRISAAQPGGKSYRFPVISGAGALAPVNARDVAAVTSTVNVYTTSGIRRTLKFHALPDDLTVFNVDGSESSALDPRVANFIDTALLGKYAIKAQAIPAKLATRRIADITVAEKGDVSFQCDTVGLLEGQHIRVSSCQGWKANQFHGVWRVGKIIAGPPTSIVCGTRRPIDPNYFYSKATGTIRDAETSGFNFLPMASRDNFQVASTRKVGRPTDAPRGRSSNRR